MPDITKCHGDGCPLRDDAVAFRVLHWCVTNA